MLRYYEQRGLLHPQRRPSGSREYGEADVTTVHRIRALLDAGLSTAPTPRCCRACAMTVRSCGPRARRCASLAAERERMTSAIAALSTSRDLLDRVLSPAAAGT
jgi:DNA-binding transcriptional MerR regulator